MHISTIKPGEFSPAVVARADVTATLIDDCDPVFITSHGLRVPEEPGGELQNLAEEVGWNKLVTLPELLQDLHEGRNETRGRTTRSQVTCFLNPLGLGYQFAAVGSIIYRHAKEKHIGHELPTDWFTQKEIPLGMATVTTIAVRLHCAPATARMVVRPIDFTRWLLSKSVSIHSSSEWLRSPLPTRGIVMAEMPRLMAMLESVEAHS